MLNIDYSMERRKNQSPMKILLEIFFLCLLYQLSVELSYFLPGSIPPSLIGMALVLSLLTLGILRPQHLQQSSRLLNRHMMLFFIPVIVGIIQYWGVLKQGGWHLAFTLVISTAFVLICTALIPQIFKRR
jgi:holin-like protein